VHEQLLLLVSRIRSGDDAAPRVHDERLAPGATRFAREEVRKKTIYIFSFSRTCAGRTARQQPHSTASPAREPLQVCENGPFKNKEHENRKENKRNHLARRDGEGRWREDDLGASTREGEKHGGEAQIVADRQTAFNTATRNGHQTG
jgi:hypothetical protein